MRPTDLHLPVWTDLNLPAYLIYASSALAGQSLVRNLSATGFPLFTNQVRLPQWCPASCDLDFVVFSLVSKDVQQTRVQLGQYAPRSHRPCSRADSYRAIFLRPANPRKVTLCQEACYRL